MVCASYVAVILTHIAKMDLLSEKYERYNVKSADIGLYSKHRILGIKTVLIFT